MVSHCDKAKSAKSNNELGENRRPWKTTFDIFGPCSETEAETHDQPDTSRTHPSAAERQILSNNVDAEYLEHFMRGYLLLGDVLGVGQLERLLLRLDVPSLLLPRGGIWHLSAST